MSSLTNNKNLKDITHTVNFPLKSFTTMELKRDRWSTMRIRNVDIIAKEWKKNPNQVVVLSDPKLRNSEMVMLRKDKFESIVKLFKDLVNGQAFIEHDLKTVMDALFVAQDQINDKSNQLGKEVLEPLLKQINVIINVTQSLESRVIVSVSSKKKDKIQKLNKDDLFEDEDFN